MYVGMCVCVSVCMRSPRCVGVCMCTWGNVSACVRVRLRVRVFHFVRHEPSKRDHFLNVLTLLLVTCMYNLGIKCESFVDSAYWDVSRSLKRGFVMCRP